MALKREFTFEENMMSEIVSKSKIRSNFNYLKFDNLLFQNYKLNEEAWHVKIIKIKRSKATNF